MRFLLLNQCFHPDVAATAQHLTDLAAELASRGHDVTVVTGDRAYDDPAVRFPRRERWQNITIIRVRSLPLGKNSKWRRALTFASFLATCGVSLLRLKRFDVVVALTSPPLISFLAALFVKLKGGRFCFWAMDLNPDEAIAAGWLRPDSTFARLFQWMLRYSVDHADRTIALDRFMKDRLVSKGANAERIVVIPPWSLDDAVAYSAEGREAFRKRHGLTGKFVVMYSGNHSPCHPLDTLLAAARELKDHADFVFYFIGGGSEHAKVREFAQRHALSNLKCLPYQPLSELSSSLSAADLHAVVMGDAFVGIVHPSKVYNIMCVGAPILYIGPATSHVTDLADSDYQIFLARHRNTANVVAQIFEARKCERRPLNAFSKHALLPELINVLEAEPESEPYSFVREVTLP